MVRLGVRFVTWNHEICHRVSQRLFSGLHKVRNLRWYFKWAYMYSMCAESDCTQKNVPMHTFKFQKPQRRWLLDGRQQTCSVGVRSLRACDGIYASNGVKAGGKRIWCEGKQSFTGKGSLTPSCTMSHATLKYNVSCNKYDAKSHHVAAA